MNMIRGEVVKLTVINQIKKNRQRIFLPILLLFSLYTYQTLPVLNPALPFSHKVFSNTFHADNLGLGCLPCPIKSICVIYQFISNIAPAFLSTNATPVWIRSVCTVWEVPFCIFLPNRALKQTGGRRRPNPNDRWIRHLPWRFVNGSHR